MENEKLKKNGDKFLAEKQYEKAEEIYNKILNNEPFNERVLSNISLIYLYQEKYENVIECCSKILKIFSTFKEKINLKNTNNLFEIKILLRRAKCYEILNDMQKAEKDIEKIEKLEITNTQVLKDIKLIKDKLKIHVVNTYKEQANELLQKGNFSEALEYYDKAINVIKFSNIYNKIDLVKILLNRSACLIKLTQYEKTYELFEKIFNILSKQKAIADIQSNIVLSNEVKKLQFLTYVKRAFVYSINNKIDDAIKDYENALVLKPEDIKIKENIQKLKMFNK
jgi:tetratricopeptide (TPR) repeat protein